MLILTDTNVLLRLAEPGHSQYQIADVATETIRNAGHELAIVPQNIFEFWVVATRPATQNGMGISVPDAFDMLTRLRRLYRLLPDERTIVEIWQELVLKHGIQGKPAHDARLAAALKCHSLSHLLTFNGVDFIRFPFLTVLNPIDVVNGSAAI